MFSVFNVSLLCTSHRSVLPVPIVPLVSQTIFCTMLTPPVLYQGTAGATAYSLIAVCDRTVCWSVCTVPYGHTNGGRYGSTARAAPVQHNLQPLFSTEHGSIDGKSSVSLSRPKSLGLYATAPSYWRPHCVLCVKAAPEFRMPVHFRGRMHNSQKDPEFFGPFFETLAAVRRRFDIVCALFTRDFAGVPGSTCAISRRQDQLFRSTLCLLDAYGFPCLFTSLSFHCGNRCLLRSRVNVKITCSIREAGAGRIDPDLVRVEHNHLGLLEDLRQHIENTTSAFRRTSTSIVSWPWQTKFSTSSLSWTE